MKRNTSEPRGKVVISSLVGDGEEGSESEARVSRLPSRLTTSQEKDLIDAGGSALPPWPYTKDSFRLILGELEDPEPALPCPQSRWLTLPELALSTGVFVTGSVGSGMTAAVACPLDLMLLGGRSPAEPRPSVKSATLFSSLSDATGRPEATAAKRNTGGVDGDNKPR